MPTGKNVSHTVVDVDVCRSAGHQAVTALGRVGAAYNEVMARNPLIGHTCRAILVAAFGAIAITCASPGRDRGVTPVSGGVDSAAESREVPFEGTAGIVQRPSGGEGIVLLGDVRVGRHDGFDRVTFELSGAALPGYHLEYVDRPVRQCGSGHATPIAGDGWLEVRLEPVHGHDEAGNPTTPRELHPGLPVLAELERTCDFEAVVTYVLGLHSPNPYRVLELRDPTRLVVDVRH